MTQAHDQLVARYLEAVVRAAAELPAHRRDDLVVDLREHIESARADLVEGAGGETADAVAAILRRLGDPVAIVNEARLGLTPPPAPTPPMFVTAPPRARRRLPVWGTVLISVAVAVVILCVGTMALGAVLFQQPSRESPVSGTPVDAPSFRPPAPTPS
jgi:hypothetical protein